MPPDPEHPSIRSAGASKIEWEKKALTHNSELSWYFVSIIDTPATCKSYEYKMVQYAEPGVK
jgi:hypothetical protein